MKDEIIIFIRKWFKSKTGIDLIHDPSLISLVNEIEALRIHDVVGRSEQLVICKKCGSSEMYQYTKTKDKCEECGNIQDY